MARRSKEDTDKTRAALLDAAEELFLLKGVAATSLDDIAKSIKMTRGAVYWHFENKGALLEAMSARVKMPMDILFEQANASTEPMEALKNLCIEMLRYMAKDERVQRTYTIMLFKCEQMECCVETSNRQKQKRDDVIKKFQGFFTRAEQAGALADNILPQAAAISLHAFILGLFSDYLRRPGSYNLKKMAPVFINQFFVGLVKP